MYFTESSWLWLGQMMLGLLRCSQDNDGLFGMTLAKKLDRNCISDRMMIQNGEQIVRDFHGMSPLEGHTARRQRPVHRDGESERDTTSAPTYVRLSAIIHDINGMGPGGLEGAAAYR
jgi:hypothetical protein